MAYIGTHFKRNVIFWCGHIVDRLLERLSIFLTKSLLHTGKFEFYYFCKNILIIIAM